MDQAHDTTVILADDHVIVREGIAALCASHELRILEQCSDGEAALEAILRLKPDLAILDLQMPGMTGVEVIRRLRAAGCREDVRWEILGHEKKTVAEGYGEGFPVPVLKRWIDRIGF